MTRRLARPVDEHPWPPQRITFTATTHHTPETPMCDGTPCPCNLLTPRERAARRPALPRAIERDVSAIERERARTPGGSPSSGDTAADRDEARDDVRRFEVGLRRIAALGVPAFAATVLGMLIAGPVMTSLSGTLVVVGFLGCLAAGALLAWWCPAHRGVYRRRLAAERAHTRAVRARADAQAAAVRALSATQSPTDTSAPIPAPGPYDFDGISPWA